MDAAGSKKASEMKTFFIRFRALLVQGKVYVCIVLYGIESILPTRPSG